jgi:hypothetical protein
MLDKLITYIVWWYKSCLLRELTASQLVAITTRSDTGAHNRLDLTQNIAPPHYVCNGYIYDKLMSTSSLKSTSTPHIGVH